jgi:hypothetical protein
MIFHIVSEIQYLGYLMTIISPYHECFVAGHLPDGCCILYVLVERRQCQVHVTC